MSEHAQANTELRRCECCGHLERTTRRRLDPLRQDFMDEDRAVLCDACERELRKTNRRLPPAERTK